MTESLYTVRDFLRYAVTSFRRSDISYGHGAADAIDEAAFMVLEALSLPIDDINPWLDAQLTAAERRRVLDLVKARVETRKPAAYLLNKAYIQGLPFYVDERVIVPRSFIGEILASEPAFLPQADGVASVLDLCTGSGCLAVLASFYFPNAEIHGVDLSPDALDVARRNIADHGLEDVITLHQGDLFAPLGDQRFDVILTNPPYVDAGAMAHLPAEYRAEPVIALAGGPDGLDIVRRIITGGRAHLNPGGGVLCEFGTGRDILEAEYSDLPFLWPDTEESEGEVFWLAEDDLPK
ncbi:MAG: 50S ribosomal protein L3 N(5)-glutamine methyltransferase [Parvularculaceae bacterium]